MNLMFVIMLDAYEKTRRKHVLTLLSYSIIWNGLVQFFYNWVLKIASTLKLQKLLFKLV